MFRSLLFTVLKIRAICKTEHAAWDLNGSHENQVVKVPLGTDAGPLYRV